MAKKRAQVKDLAREIGKSGGFELPEQEAYLNLLRTCQSLAGEFERLFEQYGLSDAQYNALRILRGHGKAMQVYQVAGQMVTRQPDITRLFDRLEKAKLIKRRRCEEDRRVVWVELTQAAREVLKKLDEPVLRLHRKQLGHLGPRKLRQLSQLLTEARQCEPGI